MELVLLTRTKSARIGMADALLNSCFSGYDNIVGLHRRCFLRATKGIAAVLLRMDKAEQLMD